MFTTILRHLMAVAAAYAAQWAAKQGVALDPAQIVALMIAIYAAVEKGLKPAESALVAAITKKAA